MKAEQTKETDEDGSWREETTQFLNKTTLHGFRYVTDNRASLWRRCAWLLLIVVGFGWTLQVFTQSMMQYFSYHSVISETSFEADCLDFPALTFCPVNKLKNSSLHANLPQLYPYLDTYAAALLAINFSEIRPEIVGLMQEYGFWDTYLTNAPTLSDTFVECNVMNQRVDCEYYMRISVSHQGVCFTFNSHLLAHDDVIRMHASGASVSVSFIIDVNPEEYYFPAGITHVKNIVKTN